MIERAIKIDSAFEVSSAAHLVQAASRFKSHIHLIMEEKTANAKSIMGLISLELSGGSIIKIVVEGEDEQHVIPELESILLSRR